MTRMIFINLPVANLARSRAFYEGIGFTNNAQFSDEAAAGMTLTDEIHVMLMTHEKFMSFSPRPIADPRRMVQALLCYSAESREAVDSTLSDVERSGGVIDPTPADDYGFMYGRSFEDPDGHLWQVMWMDPAAVEQGAAAFENA